MTSAPSPATATAVPLSDRILRDLPPEDPVNGARSAVAAGYPTIGILQFVPEADRRPRTDALREVGVAAVVESWADVERLLSRSGATTPARGSATVPACR